MSSKHYPSSHRQPSRRDHCESSPAVVLVFTENFTTQEKMEPWSSSATLQGISAPNRKNQRRIQRAAQAKRRRRAQRRQKEIERTNTNKDLQRAMEPWSSVLLAFLLFSSKALKIFEPIRPLYGKVGPMHESHRSREKVESFSTVLLHSHLLLCYGLNL